MSVVKYFTSTDIRLFGYLGTGVPEAVGDNEVL